MHPTWAGDLFHTWWYTCFSAILSDHPTLASSHRVQKSVLYICVSFSVLHVGLSLPSFKIPYICVSILYWCLSFWLTSLFSFFFNTMELQKIETSELPLPLRSPGQCSGKRGRCCPVPLARMDAVSKSGQKRWNTCRGWTGFHFPSYIIPLAPISGSMCLSFSPFQIAGSLSNHKVSPRDVKWAAQGHPGSEQLRQGPESKTVEPAL